MNLEVASSTTRRRQVVRVARKAIALFASVFALTGCMNMMPSSHPRPPMPTPDVFPPPPTSLPQPSRSLPQPSTSPGMPSPSTQPGQTGSPSSMPGGMPSPTGRGTPGLPSIPTSGMPSTPSVLPSPPTSGMPQTPSMPSPSSSSSSGSQQGSGTNFPSVPGLPELQTGDRSRGSQAESGSGQQRGGVEEGQQGQLPSGGPLQTADDSEQNSENEASGEGGMASQRSGDERQSGSAVGAETGEDIAGLPSSGAGDQPEGGQEIEIEDDPGAGVLGTPDGNENGGWVVSNELPENEKVRQGIPDPATEEDEEGSAKSESDEALEATLAGIDGNIMADREEHAEKINERAGGETLPGDAVLAEEDQRGSEGGTRPSAVGGTSREHIPNVTDPNRRSQPPDPNRPSITIGQADIPDAKDDDVIARQLREAALAEKDPELREALWEELRRYLEKRK
ncbi:MAG: hypothetical protein OXG05_04070 [Gammaproteobacteria bacterium]|nr:hypothetical protein [Gammaproteobacteria bacterium]